MLNARCKFEYFILIFVLFLGPDKKMIEVAYFMEKEQYMLRFLSDCF